MKAFALVSNNDESGDEGTTILRYSFTKQNLESQINQLNKMIYDQRKKECSDYLEMLNKALSGIQEEIYVYEKVKADGHIVVNVLNSLYKRKTNTLNRIVGYQLLYDKVELDNNAFYIQEIEIEE